MNKTISPPPSSPELTAWTLQCDFDGTISLIDVTDSVLNHFGMTGWREVEAAWERGEIGSRQCMQRQVALLDVDERELRAHLDTIQIDAAFAEFVECAESRGMAVEVVSDGIDYAIRHILNRHGLGHLPVTANTLMAAGPRRWTLQSPHARTDCTPASGTCKCARLARQHDMGKRVAFIGDGRSDFCVSGRADRVFAKNSLVLHCLDHDLRHTRFEHFGQLIVQLDALTTNHEEMA